MIGIIFALGAAFCWTYACFLWRKQTRYFSSIQLNLLKNIIAFIIFLPILFTIDIASHYREISILFLSGVIGIAIGDSLYITALNQIGTRKTLTVEALSPILASILGSIVLEEILPLKVWIGILLACLSLIGVAIQKETGVEIIRSNSSNKKGFISAFLSVFCAVIAGTLSRIVLINSDLNPFQTTEIRLFAGIFALLPAFNFTLIRSIQKVNLPNKSRLLYATLLGTNLGILLQQYVFLLLPIGIGWTILSTSPAISLFFASSEGEKISWESFLLTMSTILGVSIALI